ncbi:MAG: hypothetical protein NTY88_03560 [Bacteroidetes bacterium]|nr:hypothetical protein [Bacteroidota bacterium]
MKNVLLTISILVMASSLVSAQVPEFKNTIMVVKSDGTLDKTEKQTATLKNKGGNRGGGWGYSFGASGDMEYITLQGLKSPVRLASGTTFIVKLTDAETDPESAFYLTEVVVAKNTREIYTKKDSGRSVKEK